MASDRINFVNENDARGVLLALFKQIAHAAGAHAYEHFHEIGTGNREERNVCFTRDGSSQQRFARSRRPDEQHALGNAAAQLLKLLGILQELNDLLQLFLGFVAARHILEGRLFLLRRKQSRARLSEAERLVTARLHLAHQEENETGQQQQWK